MLAAFALIILFSFSITFLLTPLIISAAFKFKLVDNSKLRPHPAHTHKGTIPRAGGIPIFIGIFLPIILLNPTTFNLWGILAGSILLILIGILDDRKDISPYIRFSVNCLAAAIAVLAGIKIPYITNPFGGVIDLDFPLFPLSAPFDHLFSASTILAFFWILWTTNIVGWSGGVDGQLPGFTAITSFVIGILSLRFARLDQNQLIVSFLSFATTGAFIGFLPWNFFPQKIMPGYGGKTLAGYMLGVLSIMSFSKLGTAILVLAIPITDAFFMIFKRIFSGKSPFRGTSEHLHHHLLKLGWGRRRIAIFYWIISALAGTAALLLNSKQKIFAVILTVVLIFIFLIWINFLKKLPKKYRIE